MTKYIIGIIMLKKGKRTYEVPYHAPRNSKGVKPCFIDIWHPDEGIGISTIKSAVKEFVKRFIGIDNCQVEIGNVVDFEEAIKTFKENESLFKGDKPIEIKISPALIEELSTLWGKSKKEVIEKLKKAAK